MLCAVKGEVLPNEKGGDDGAGESSVSGCQHAAGLPGSSRDEEQAAGVAGV